MRFDSLTDFLGEIEQRGELHRVAAPVSSRFEIAAVTRQSALQSPGNPALVFEQVDGQAIPVATNVLGTRERLELGLGVRDFQELGQRLIDLLAPDLPQGWLNALQLVPRVSQLMKLPPAIVKTGRCQQVVRVGKDVNLGTFPIPYSWQGEAAPVVTAGIVHAFDPVSNARILRRIPLELKHGNSLALHLPPDEELHAAALEYRRRGVQMPLAVSLGVEPVLWFCSQLPLPRGTDPAMMAGFLRNTPLELVKARSQDVQIPAHAEFVIEGYLDAAEAWDQAGPIASPTGFYGPEESAPLMHVTTITHAANPVFHAAIVGPPPNEEHWIGRAAEQLFLPLIRLFVRDVVELHWPRCGMFRNLLFVSIRKTHPEHARQTMHALWGLHGLASAKIIVVVDEEIDVSNEELVWHTVGVNCHPGRDSEFAKGPTHAYDHAAPVRFVGHKMGLDATAKLPGEGFPRPWPARVEIPEETRRRIAERWSEFGLADSAEQGESS
jgi:4-hydroxy-3-polyprenylbenzoate decarboxylase